MTHKRIEEPLYDILSSDCLKNSFEAYFKNVGFTSDEEVIVFDLVVAYFYFQFKITKINSYIYKICSLYKRRYKRNHPDIVKYSFEALENKEQADAVVYYCSSLISNKEEAYAMEKLRELSHILSDDNNKLIVEIYLATLSWRKSDFQSYRDGIKGFLEAKEKDFNPYVSIPCSTVYLGDERPRRVFNGILSRLDESVCDLEDKDVSYCITVSCDSKYFDIYWDYFYTSLRSTGDNFYCRVVVTDSLGWCPEVDDDRFYIKELGMEGLGENVGPISSALRFLSAYQLLDKYHVPVVVSDFDCAFKSHGLEGLISGLAGSAAGLRLLNKKLVMPWEYITAGFSVFMPKRDSFYFLEIVVNFLSGVLVSGPAQWWVDQNAVECAHRFTDFNGFVDIKSIIDRYVVIPTGSADTKKKILEKAVQEAGF
ncbi:hypothetical protein MKP05_18225 [Halomonas sp. EGI 63088]|uniref:HEPN/Toprim N-terminal domain-containing protein n=1 Tax=Halomonas flagellata TaxID=2920385 RepID=A0ABS9RYU9_9GAMM|nr:hypothetical protein [Halomonas flagellata]MCH4565038.1 hypothetical protein [Halomonas flagellata]